MEMVIARHKAAGVEVPPSLCVDCSFFSDNDEMAKTGNSQGIHHGPRRAHFMLHLDAMHLMLRIRREVNAEHPRRKKLLVDLRHAIFLQHPGDLEALVAARKTAKLFKY